MRIFLSTMKPEIYAHKFPSTQKDFFHELMSFQGLFLLILHFTLDFVLAAMLYVDQRHMVPSNG